MLDTFWKKTYKFGTKLRSSDLQLSDGGEYVHSVIHVHLLDDVMDGDKQSAKGGTVTGNEKKTYERDREREKECVIILWYVKCFRINTILICLG